jgi:hypothetical protein
MSRATVCHRQQLEVTVMFEPTRMASVLLQAAYLRIRPTVRRSLARGPAPPAAAAVPTRTGAEGADTRERSAQ